MTNSSTLVIHHTHLHTPTCLKYGKTDGENFHFSWTISYNRETCGRNQDIMRTNAPSLLFFWCKPKSGIPCSLCMPQRQRPVLLVRMPTADADLESGPACHLLFRMEGRCCFLVSCTIVLRQHHSYLLVTSLIHDVIEAYNHSISLLRIRRVVPTGVHE